MPGIGHSRCDIGGDYWYLQIPGPAVYRQPCEAQPTHRWRSDVMVVGTRAATALGSFIKHWRSRR